MTNLSYPFDSDYILKKKRSLKKHNSINQEMNV